MKPDRNVSNTSFSSSDEQIPDEDLFTSSKRYDTVIFIVCVPPFIISMYAFLYLCLCLHPHVHINTNINTVTCTQRLNRKTDNAKFDEIATFRTLQDHLIRRINNRISFSFRSFNRLTKNSQNVTILSHFFSCVCVPLFTLSMYTFLYSFLRLPPSPCRPGRPRPSSPQPPYP